LIGEREGRDFADNIKRFAQTVGIETRPNERGGYRDHRYRQSTPNEPFDFVARLVGAWFIHGYRSSSFGRSLTQSPPSAQRKRSNREFQNREAGESRILCALRVLCVRYFIGSAMSCAAWQAENWT